MKNLIITLFFSIFILNGYSQIYGPTSVTAGDISTYNYWGHACRHWSCNGGTILSYTNNSVTVKWTTPGEGFVRCHTFFWIPLSTFRVTISYPFPSTPLALNPTNVMVGTKLSFVARWNSVEYIESYRLDVSDYPDFRDLLKDNLEVFTTSKNVELGVINKLIYYRVRAQNPAGTSPNSNIVCVLQPPVADYANKDTDGFTANWRSVYGATGYKLDVSTNSSFSPCLTGYRDLTVQGTSKYVTVQDICPYYYYRIRAFNDYGTSENSNVIFARAKAPYVAALPATDITSNSFVAHWEQPPCAWYHIEYDTDPNFIHSTHEGGLDFYTSWRVPNLNPNTTYYYRIITLHDRDMVSNTITVTTALSKKSATVTTNDSHNTFEEKNAIDISLYPNPVKERLYITGIESDLVKITIYTTTGNVIKQVNQNIDDGIDVHYLIQGIYLLQIDDGNNLKKLTFIKE